MLLGLVVLGGWLAWWSAFRVTHAVTNDAFVESDMVDFAARVPGEIVEMLVTDNESVKAGTLLCRIDPAPYERLVAQDTALLKVAQAQLATAQTALERLQQRVPQEIAFADEALKVAESDQRAATHSLALIQATVDHGISIAKQAVATADATLAFAKVSFERWQALVTKEAVSFEERDEREKSLQVATAVREEALLRLSQAQSDAAKVAVADEVLAASNRRIEQAKAEQLLAQLRKLDVDEAEREVATAQARIQAAEADLHVHELQLSYTQVVAPFDAVVARRFQFAGDWATPGVPIFSLYDHGNLYVTAHMPETKLDGVWAGCDVRVDVDAFDEPFDGSVLWVGRATGAQFALVPRDLSSGEFTKVVQRVPVRILIKRDERWPRLSPGLSTTVAVRRESSPPRGAGEAVPRVVDPVVDQEANDGAAPSGARTPVGGAGSTAGAGGTGSPGGAGGPRGAPGSGGTDGTDSPAGHGGAGGGGP